MNLYLLLKFIHVVAAMLWVGGVLTVGVLNARVYRERDAAAIEALSKHGLFLGRAVMGPSAFITLVAGISLMVVMGGGFSLWMAWGLVGVFGSMILGARVLAPANQRVAELAGAATGAATGAAAVPQPEAFRNARRRLMVWGAVNFGLLISTVWAMVFKPTL